MKSFLCAIFVISIFYTGYGGPFAVAETIAVDSFSMCGDDDWVTFKDEKCFKLIKEFTTLNKTEEICKQQYSKTDSYLPTLVSIKSEAEQEFLTEYLFDTQGIIEGVWIGAKRQEGNSSQFVWNDGSDIDFTNWAENYPIDQVDRDCVEMRSKFVFKSSNISRSYVNGKWSNVHCNKNSWVLCQKLQYWSFPQLQKILLETRKELKDSLEDVTKQLKDTKNELTTTRNELGETKNEVKHLQQNPVPIGFIYAQLPGQPEPRNLWPTATWEDVSSKYAGLFFRVLGSGSAGFGENIYQEQASPRITSVQSTVNDGFRTHYIDLPLGQWSNWVTLGAWSGDNVQTQFYQNWEEVRPRNQAILIWKRIN